MSHKTNFHCEECRYLKEKMDEFTSVCPYGKPATCLEDFRKFSVKDFQGILKHYNENIRKKSKHSDENLCHFCRFQPKFQS